MLILDDVDVDWDVCSPFPSLHIFVILLDGMNMLQKLEGYSFPTKFLLEGYFIFFSEWIIFVSSMFPSIEKYKYNCKRECVL